MENSKGEAGVGQHELNVSYSTILDMADRHVVYKQCLKEVAMLNDMAVTFMSKPYTDATGSGMHIHLSLYDKDTEDGNTVFIGNDTIGSIAGCSKDFLHFLGGWMTRTPECFPFYAPMPNSYKRFVTASWAPTKIAWADDNRTGGFRIVGQGKSLRIEMRIPGADANPYLAFAASLASGLDGIKNEIKPPSIFDGDIYAARSLPEVP